MLAVNSDRYIEYFLGVYWAGCVVNPANIRWSAGEIAYSLDDCETKVLIVDDQFLPMVPELRESAKSLTTLIYAGEGATPEGMLSFEALIEQATPIPDTRRSGTDLAGVFYTGGTTGFPKGVMLAHAGLYINALAMAAEGTTLEGTIGLHAAPMFHLACIAVMNSMFVQCCTHVIIPAFTPVSVLQTIQQECVTTTLLVPTMMQMTVDHPDVDQYDLSSLRTVLYGASPISEAVIDRAIYRLPNANFFQAYGMTELSPAATILAPFYHTPEGRKLNKIRSAGRPILCAEVRIVDHNDKEVMRGGSR